MAASKSKRIIILLIIDSLFFLLELIVGYSVHSLALVADSFHMLNDVLSLCVGLWAVRVANQENNSKNFTYGWQRAETLGALVNGVFLVALCMSIFLEAIQRLVEPQVVKNPRLVCIVGCFGLLSNILGLLLFHDHSHSGHDHTPPLIAGDLNTAENGYGIADDENLTNMVTSEPNDNPSRTNKRIRSEYPATDPLPVTPRKRNAQGGRRFSSSTSRRLGYVEDIPSHPAILRQDIINRADEESIDSEPEDSIPPNEQGMSERTTLLEHPDRAGDYMRDLASRPQTQDPDLHESHYHEQPTLRESKSHHSHSDLNMKGVFLHVMGDALGNIGVIASALVIWLTDYDWRFYVDPGISLFITVVILASAIPLCKAASRILLQAMPADMSIDRIREDIEHLPGVLSTHHLHVWQLSDTKLVASLHIKVDCEIKDEGSERYMSLAKQVRKCLHGYGIHSSTIQPEFATESEIAEAQNLSLGRRGSGDDASSLNSSSQAASFREHPGVCLLECGDECPPYGKCCPYRP